ncbi:type IV pilus biogenesis/stability protein PilW [Erwinia psidii]|uniref:Type IV pilus biogenesis/stability protein PilW n=1 Tax=Erwinia psidii TaxID=69224 RepID=A0A3N6SJG9_9GAMM|nr:type IV pilus biogenesis/stability protein PilW [Erwinia psidii]MCX8956779.1 type IV pilus biogenesis/stability protein PilW [Erwinia psidii]MCX8960409.1 type IV pilus biogenesis/stability protein PilW [Erwinia psidii]MCX8964408.1 type IV pilus biogenesis/stability protein PilW [Erwinia psidii]RQM40103.1 type IV pilus biogenesis/stability protein PilW [Erwinia psidii]
MGKGFPVWLVLLLSACGTSSQNNELALTRLQLGLEYLARDRLEPARRNLEQAVRLIPDDYRSHLAMARYQQRLGHQDMARRHYQRALRLAGDNRDVINNYGAFLCGLGQYDAAQLQFSKAADSSENHNRADAIENAGYCYIRAGEKHKAEAALAEATRNDAQKGKVLLAEAERRFGNNERDASRLLLDIYQRNFAASAESLWLEIRFAAQAEHPEVVRLAGEQLARNFPQSIQYLHFLANEY